MAKQKKQEPIERATEVDAEDIGVEPIKIKSESLYKSGVPAKEYFSTTTETDDAETLANIYNAAQIHKVNMR